MNVGSDAGLSVLPISGCHVTEGLFGKVSHGVHGGGQDFSACCATAVN